MERLSVRFDEIGETLTVQMKRRAREVTVDMIIAIEGSVFGGHTEVLRNAGDDVARELVPLVLRPLGRFLVGDNRLLNHPEVVLHRSTARLGPHLLNEASLLKLSHMLANDTRPSFGQT